MLLLVACCYFWCCLCTTGNKSERERVRAAFASIPAINKRPPAAAPRCPVLSPPSPFPFSPASSLLAVIFRALTLPTWHAIVMVQSFPQWPAVFPWLQHTSTDSLSPHSLPLSHFFAYHINSSGCLFFLSIVYFLVSVFSVLLSNPEHSKKAKKAKNVDLLLLFLCRLLLKA